MQNLLTTETQKQRSNLTSNHAEPGLMNNKAQLAIFTAHQHSATTNSDEQLTSSAQLMTMESQAELYQTDSSFSPQTKKQYKHP
jgi:hypothetical protein